MKNSTKTPVASTGRKTVRATTSAPKSAKAAPAAAAARVPTQEEIARRSFEIYLDRGASDGHHVEDWLRAEAELLGK